VPKLLDPDDMVGGKADDKSVLGEPEP